MNATETTRVEIDDRIREKPELLRAVTDATDYLRGEIESVMPPATIRWQQVGTDGKLLQITLSDWPETSNHTVQRNYWTRWIQDPVNQKICVLKIWGELLGKRSDANLARIKAQISELMTQSHEEEIDGR